jgi:hypothetical protein
MNLQFRFLIGTLVLLAGTLPCFSRAFTANLTGVVTHPSKPVR